MARFRNDSGSVLAHNDLMRSSGPGEEFDWPGYDPHVHGVIPGCTRLDEPEDKPSRTRGKPADKDKESGE